MQGHLDDRERQFEAKFAHDQDIQFKVRVHRDRLFAHWAVDQLGDRAPPEYAESFIAAALPRKPEELIATVVKDLHDHGIAIADTRVRRAFENCVERAREEVMKEI